MNAIKEKYGYAVNMSHLEGHLPKAGGDDNEEPG